VGQQQVPVEDVLRKEQYRQISDALARAGQSRVRLPLDQYLDLCRQHEVADEEARVLLRALHQSGRVLHYENMPGLAGSLIVRPDVLASSLARLLDLDGHGTKAFVQAKQQELQSLRQELDSLEATHRTLSHKANRRADFWIGLGLGYITLQGALVARLTWWELSWDIMEPVTYMLTFTTAIGGMLYFAATKTEYTYESLRNNLAQGRLKKLYKIHGFDIAKYNELKRAMAQKEEELKTPEVSLLKFQPLALH